MVDKGGLIAVGELGAAKAVSPDLARQFHLVYISKSVPFEEVRMVGKAEDGVDAKCQRLLEAGGYQLVTKSFSLIFFGDNHRPYFSEV